MHRNIRFSRRSLLVAAGAAATLGGTLAVPAWAEEIDVDSATGDRILGDPKAPITVQEYASLTCPHCAHFHKEILPRIKQQFIDNGQVKFIFRDFPFDRVALSAAMLARCAPPDRYFGYLSVIFGTQGQWIGQPDPVKALTQTLKLGGLTEAHAEACLANEKVRDSVVNSRMTGEQKWKVDATPTFIVNDGAAKIAGANEEELVKALKKAGAKPAS
jgi:protein-disulfide isomerase